MRVSAFGSSQPHSVLGLTVEDAPTILPTALGPWTLLCRFDLSHGDERHLGVRTGEAIRELNAKGYYLTGAASLALEAAFSA